METPRERRRRLDRERYLRNAEERRERQRTYYREHREELLLKVKLRSAGLYVRHGGTPWSEQERRERKRRLNRRYYIEHREAILEGRRARYMALTGKKRAV